MRAIDKIIQASKDQRRSVQVPGTDETWYFGPLTTADMEAVRLRMAEEEGKDSDHPSREYERRLNLLVLKAEYEDGSKVFEWGDLPAIREHFEWSTLQRVVAVMYGSLIPGSTAERRKEEAKN